MDFRFAHLLGAPYRGGNVVFDQEYLISSVGNRLQSTDLRQGQCRTLPVECLQPIQLITLSPCQKIILLFDIEDRLIVIHHDRETVLHHMKFQSSVACAMFSPDGRFVAIAVGSRLEVWKRPLTEKQIAPMHMYRSYNPMTEAITCLDWASDSFGIAVGAKDMSTRIYTIDPVVDYKPAVLGGHRGSIVGVFFVEATQQKKSEIGGEIRDRPIHLITVGAMGKLSEWSYHRTNSYDSSVGEISRKRKSQSMDIDQDLQSDSLICVRDTDAIAEKERRIDWEFHGGRWMRCFFHSFELNGKTEISDVDYHKGSGFMVVAFSNGIFELVQFPGFHRIQVLSVSQERITSIRFSADANWIAIGCAKLGQLLVWDWRSESQVLKQQGHTFDVSSIHFSPDGTQLVTGADDTKVKIFSMTTGFCTMTFKDHLMPVTDVGFFPNGNAIVSASLDGTVRAFDLIRRRLFRTFTSPDPVQFSCLAIDPNGEFVAAGSQDSFQIFVWSIKTTKLLDILAAHEGPISAIAFNPIQPVLASSSWDGSVKIWDVFGTAKGSIESMTHNNEVTTFTFRPDGKQLASAALDGGIHFWDTVEGVETSPFLLSF